MNGENGKEETEQKSENKSPKKSHVISCVIAIISICLIGGAFLIKYHNKKMAEQAMWDSLENSKSKKEDNKIEPDINNQNKTDENAEKIYEKTEKYTIDGEDFALGFDIKKDKKTGKEIGTLSALGVCNTKEKAILMETSLMVFFKEFQKMDSDTSEFNHMVVISVTDDNKSTITNSDINGQQVVGGTNNDGSTASGKMPDWYDSLINEAFLLDGSTGYMEEVKTAINQFIDDMKNDF